MPKSRNLMVNYHINMPKNINLMAKHHINML